jgi:hypothetical protein
MWLSCELELASPAVQPNSYSLILLAGHLVVELKDRKGTLITK